MLRRRVPVMSAVVPSRCVTRVSGVHMSVARAAGVSEVRGIAHVSAVTTMSAVTGVAEVSDAADRHRRQAGATEGEAETIKVHTKYYVSDRALVTG